MKLWHWCIFWCLALWLALAGLGWLVKKWRDKRMIARIVDEEVARWQGEEKDKEAKP